MANENINIQLQEINKLPKTEDENGLFIVASQEVAGNNKAVTYPLKNKADVSYVEELEKKVKKIEDATMNSKGYYSTEAQLIAAYPSPAVGYTAWVGVPYPGVVYKCEIKGVWTATTEVPNAEEVDLNEYAKISTDEGAVIRSGELAQTTGQSTTIPVAQKLFTDTAQKLDDTVDDLTNLDNKLYSGRGVKEIIPFGVGSTRAYAAAARCLIYNNQASIQGKKIKKISVNILKIGIFSIMRCNRSGNTFTYNLIQTINIDKLGYQELSVNIDLGVNEYIGFFNTGDTAEFYYNNTRVNPVGENWYCFNTQQNAWVSFNYDICIGIYIEDTTGESGDIPTLFDDIENINNAIYAKGYLIISDITRTNNKGITKDGVISNNNNYFIATILFPNGYTHINIQAFQTNYDLGGAFYNSDNVVVGGYSFTPSQTGQGERHDIEIPDSAVKLTFCYGLDGVMESINAPIFDYVKLIGENSDKGIIQRLEDLENTESEITQENTYRSNVIPLSHIVYNNTTSSIKPLNNEIQIDVPKTSFTDNLYLNGLFDKDFSFGFNFETENRYENNTLISLFIERKDGSIITLQRNSYFLLQLVVGSTAITSVPFESPVFFDYKNAKLSISLADKKYSYDAEISNIYFSVKGSTTIANKYFIKNIKNNLLPISLDILGLYTPITAICRKGNSLLLAYWLPNRNMRVSSVNLVTKEITNRDFTNVVIPYSGGILDSHNYLYMGVDANNGLHVMGNCHASQLYYLYGGSYLDLSTLAISNKLQSSNATYPEFISNGSNFFATFREGSSGNSTNYVYRYTSGNFAKTTNVPIADGTGGKGGTAYFGKWLLCNGWYYNAWCWRTSPDVSTNNQVNLIKTQDFITFYGYAGEQLTLPISKVVNPSYCIDNVPENSGLINQWFIIPFVYKNEVHVWYMKNDEDGNTNIYLIYPDNGTYSTKKITNFNYPWSIYGTGTVDMDTINVVPVDNGDYLYMHIKHRFCGDNTYKVDKSYNVEVLDYQFKELEVPTNRMTVFTQYENLRVIANTERPYHDRMMPTESGSIIIE